MLTLGEVKRWNPGALNSAATTMQQREQILIHSGDDFGKIMPVAGWTGGAADDAGSAHRILHFRIDKMAAGASVVHKALMQAADTIPAVQNVIRQAEDLARRYGYAIGDDGQLRDLMAGQPLPAEMHPDDRARARQEIIDDVKQALQRAEVVDNDLTSVLQRAAQGEFGSGEDATVAAAAAAADSGNPGLTPPGPPPNGTPTQNAAWWATLSPADQANLLHGHPEWLGNLDGLPGSVRSQANLARVPAIRADLERQLAELRKPVDGPMLGEYDMQLHVDEINAVEAKLRSLDTVQATIAKGGRQLLFLDVTHPRVEAAVSVGNVDTAANVAVFTPGFTTTVDGDLGGYDNHMADLVRTSDRINQLHGGGPTAAVTWIGYQAPQADGGLADPTQSVASPLAAQAGGDNLARFYNGIGAAHGAANTQLHLTALGHSYGSVTTGFALGHDTPVNDAVLFGSPGQGADHLKVPAGHLYSEHNAGDNLVPLVHGSLGPSPYFSSSVMPDYHQLSTDASTSDLGPLNASYDHGGYLDAKSTSLYNMAAITTGHNDLAVNYQGPQDHSPPDVRPIPPGVPATPPTAPPPPVASPPGATPTPPPPSR